MSAKRKSEPKVQTRPRGGASLLCPVCGITDAGPTRTRDTRRMEDGSIRRERVCAKGHVTITVEEPGGV